MVRCIDSDWCQCSTSGFTTSSKLPIWLIYTIDHHLTNQNQPGMQNQGQSRLVVLQSCFWNILNVLQRCSGNIFAKCPADCSYQSVKYASMPCQKYYAKIYGTAGPHISRHILFQFCFRALHKKHLHARSSKVQKQTHCIHQSDGGW